MSSDDDEFRADLGRANAKLRAARENAAEMLVVLRRMLASPLAVSSPLPGFGVADLKEKIAAAEAMLNELDQALALPAPR